MLRIAYRPGEFVQPDPEQRHPGRGFYLCPVETCINEFFKRKRYRRIRLNLAEAEKEKLKKELAAMAHPDKVYSLVGLARKAGMLAVGQHSVERALKIQQARLVLLAEDASQNTRKKFTELAAKRGIPLRTYGKKTEWGHWMSREETAVLAILHDGFARAIETEILKKSSS